MAAPYLSEGFLREAWYVAAWDHEVPADGMLARTLLGEPVVFYRREDGRVVAMADRCCHRAAPLSQGRREGDAIRCLYHGMKFDASGRCIEIPGQDQIPEQACVRTYPVVERNRFVWIWMGEPAAADPAAILDFFWHDDPQWRMKPGYIHYQAHWQLVVDNLLDFSHLSFVHPTTLGGSEEYAQLRSDITEVPGGLHIDRWFMDHPAPPFVARVLAARGVTGHVDRWNNYDFLVPGVLIMDSGFAAAGTGAREGRREGAIEFRHCQAVTPETATSSHYFFCQPRNFAHGDEQVSEALFGAVLKAFGEDRDVITAQMRNLEDDADFVPTPCGLDGALARFRAMVQARVAAEAGAGVP